MGPRLLLVIATEARKLAFEAAAGWRIAIPAQT
jgi:hypothetical protein